MTTRPDIDLASERGTTLIELLVTIPIALAVAGAIMTLTGTFAHGQKTVETRSDAIQSAQTTVARMVRDIRQARVISPSSTTGATQTATLTLTLPSGARPSGTIIWSCTGSSPVWTCRRTVNGAVTDSAILTVKSAGSTGNQIFTVNANSTYVAISAPVPTKKPVSSSPTFTITGGVAPQNLP